MHTNKEETNMRNQAKFDKSKELLTTLFDLWKALDGNAESFEPLPNGFFNLKVLSHVKGLSKKGKPMMTTIWQDLESGRMTTTYTLEFKRNQWNQYQMIKAGDCYRVQHSGSGGFSNVEIVGDHTADSVPEKIVLPKTLSKGATSQHLFVFDIEVFKHDILIVLRDYFTKEWFIFNNDLDGFRAFYLKHRDSLFVGYNSTGYDNTVLRGYLQGKDPYILSKCLIDGKDRSAVYKLFNSRKTTIFAMDLYHDNRGFSLKEHAGFLGIDIEETQVDFDLDRELTPAEKEKNIFYCKNDVKATEKRMEQNASMLLAKVALCAYFDLDKTWLGQTNANLTAEVLQAEKQPDRKDELDPYELPEQLSITNETILETYVGRTFDSNDKGNAIINAELEVQELTEVLGVGGIHGAIKNHIHVGTFHGRDVGSLYPNTMKLFHYLSRNIPDEYTNRYSDIIEERLKAKYSDEPSTILKGVTVPMWVLDMGYKLPLNTKYGAMGAKFNKLYDPRMRLHVCITGQLAMWDLLEKIEPHVNLIQSNTDCHMFTPKSKEDEPIIEELCQDWAERTGYILDDDLFNAIYQKDVNNYLAISNKGKVKVKGAIGLTGGLKVSKAVISNAFINYVVSGKDPKEFIYECDELRQFQMISKTGWTFDYTVAELPDGTYKEAQKVNRSFAVKPEYKELTSKVRKVKAIKFEDIELDLSDIGLDSNNFVEESEVDNEETASVDTLEFTKQDGSIELVEGDSVQIVKGLPNEPDYYIIDNKAVGTGEVTLDMLDRDYYLDEVYRLLEQWFGTDWKERLTQAHIDYKAKFDELPPVKNYID